MESDVEQLEENETGDATRVQGKDTIRCQGQVWTLSQTCSLHNTMDLEGHPESSIFSIVSGKLAPASDLNAICSIVIALLSSDQDVNVNAIYELAPVPAAVFMKDGMRI